jgi:prepilin-type processing-associated H-X9-DG protein
MVIIAIAHTKKGGGFFSRLIIAILAAILFPVFAKAREKARQTQCLNNQKQIVTALLMYAQDHEELLPTSDTVWGSISMDSGVLICPTLGTKIKNGYVYSSVLSGKALGEIETPVNEIAVADGAATGASAIANVASLAKDFDTARHQGAMNAAFLDGHVERTTLLPFSLLGYKYYFNAGKNVTLSGSNVTGWTDTVTGANFAPPGGATTWPTLTSANYINNVPALYFTNTSLQFNPSFNLNTGSYTLLIVKGGIGAGSGYAALFASQCYQFCNAEFRWPGGDRPGNVAWKLTNSVVTLRITGSDVRIFENGVANYTNTSFNKGGTSATTLRIGSDGISGQGGVDSMTGKIGDIIIFDSAVSDAVRLSADAYLRSKFKL